VLCPRSSADDSAGRALRAGSLTRPPRKLQRVKARGHRHGCCSACAAEEESMKHQKSLIASVALSVASIPFLVAGCSGASGPSEGAPSGTSATEPGLETEVAGERFSALDAS